MQVGAVYTLPPVVAMTPGGLRVTIGFDEPFLVERHERGRYLIRAVKITDTVEKYDAVFYVSELALAAALMNGARRSRLQRTRGCNGLGRHDRRRSCGPRRRSQPKGAA